MGSSPTLKEKGRLADSPSHAHEERKEKEVFSVTELPSTSFSSPQKCFFNGGSEEVKAECPNCGAVLYYPRTQKIVVCKRCNFQFDKECPEC